MDKNIILMRPVEIQGYHVIGEVAKSRERKEFDPVLLHARDNYGTNAQDIVKDLLFEPSRKVVAQRLLNIGKSLGLLKESPRNNFLLTAQGERAIETGKIFVPKDGAWTLWTSTDPLLPSPILRIDPFEGEKAFREVRSNSSNDQSDYTPDYLRAAMGKEITPPASSDGITVRVKNLEDKVQKAGDSNAKLNLLWNIGEGNLRLKGTWEGKKVDAELQPPDISSDDILDDLLASERLSKKWDRQHRALQVSFDEIDDIERETMACDIEFSNPSLPDFGQFETFKVEQVPITAYSRTDAQEWSNWRLKSRISDFATSELYNKCWEEASIPLNRFYPSCPPRSDLASEAWDESSERADTRTWYLIAVEDWNLK